MFLYKIQFSAGVARWVIAESADKAIAKVLTTLNWAMDEDKRVLAVNVLASDQGIGGDVLVI